MKASVTKFILKVILYLPFMTGTKMHILFVYIIYKI